MGVICVSNLKGGVGKTSLTVNGAHALTLRGCETLILDLDPQCGAEKLLLGARVAQETSWRSAIDLRRPETDPRRLAEALLDHAPEVRTGLSVLSLGRVIGIPGESNRSTPLFRCQLVEEILDLAGTLYDDVVIDTAPVWSEELQTALSLASVVIVPVDPSRLSVMSAVELLRTVPVTPSPSYVLQRTLVSRQARRISRLSSRKIEEIFPRYFSGEELPTGCNLPKRIGLQGVEAWGTSGLSLYLSDIILYRSEQVHRLSFAGKSVFDRGGLPQFRETFRAFARQLELLLAAAENPDEEHPIDLLSALSVA